jgi:YVTN family beta-propeller protein
MKRSPAILASTAFMAYVVAVGGGCNFGQTGIAPPTNRIFLPAGIVADPNDDFVYVVNSNSDLRFNAGTVVAVDLAMAMRKRSQAYVDPPAVCSKTRFSRTEEVSEDYCCRDMGDSNIINCNEPQFIQSDATIQIGSFGGAIQLQSYQRGDVPVRRLFVAVRAEPSITFADVTVSKVDRKVAIRCTGPRQDDGTVQAPGAFCEDNWRVRRPSGATPGALELPEEPHILSLDEGLGILYVGHLTVSANNEVQGGGISTLDICHPEIDSPVRFAGLARTTFLPATVSQAVAAISHADVAAPDTRIYATARYSASVSGMVLRTKDATSCDPPSRERDLTLIPGEHFRSPAFLPYGADVRGILFSAEKQEAFILHRNDIESPTSPAAIVVLDRRPLSDGSPANSPMDILEVCNGPTSMQIHDAGRGKRIYVTCYDDGQIYVIEPDARLVTSIIDVGAGPTSLVFSLRDPGVAYIASYANSHLSIIDLKPGSPSENRVVLRIGLPHGYGE